MMGSMPNNGSSLDKLLEAWGLKFDTTKVVADMNYRMQIGGRRRPADGRARVSVVSSDGINKKDIITSELGDVWLPFAGAFTRHAGQGPEGNGAAEEHEGFGVGGRFHGAASGDNIMQNFKPSDDNYALAVRLTGKFKTAFPNGEPKDETADKDKKADKTTPKPGPP